MKKISDVVFLYPGSLRYEGTLLFLVIKGGLTLKKTPTKRRRKRKKEKKIHITYCGTGDEVPSFKGTQKATCNM